MTIAESTAIHERLRALLPRIHEQRAFLREHSRVDVRLRVPGKPLLVDRDRIFAALISKAAETHNAILLLVQNRFTNDAKALQRVLIENYVVAAWIMQDAGLRLDCYASAMRFVNNRYAEVLAEYYPNSDASMLEIGEEVQQNTKRFRELMGGTHTSWARRYDDKKGKLVPLKIVDLFDDVAGVPAAPPAPAAPAPLPAAVPPPAAPAVLVAAPAAFPPAAAAPPAINLTTFLYDVAYFDGSAAIHSTVSCLKYLIDPDARFFAITESRDHDELANILFLANMTFLMVLGEFTSYSGIDLNPELDAIGEEIKLAMQ